MGHAGLEGAHDAVSAEGPRRLGGLRAPALEARLGLAAVAKGLAVGIGAAVLEGCYATPFTPLSDTKKFALGQQKFVLNPWGVN